MSIPERLWRVARGHWITASEKVSEVAALADAYEELAEALRQPTPPAAAGSGGTRPAPAVGRPSGSQSPASSAGGHDPLEASYHLLGIQPGVTLQEVEQAYRTRLAESQPERYAAGSSERALAESRRHALEAAYHKLRDALNPTETRFGRLEF